MIERTKKYFKPVIYLVGAILWFLAVYSMYPALAVYAPGATLDPDCSPGDEGCTVSAPLVTTMTTSTIVNMGTSTLGFDTSTLYIDPINDRVGVNTTSPVATFDVDGNLMLSGTGRYINFVSATSSDGYGVRDSSGTLQFKNSGGTWTAISGALWTQSGGDLYYTTSDVGIGTTVPSTTLHVVSTTEQLRLGYDAGNYTSFIVGSDGALTITPSGSATTTISNILSVGSSAFLNGILNVVGASTFNGNVGLGDATGDSITATGRFASGLTPITNNTYDLGEGGLAWQDIYASGTVYADILKLDGLTESTMAGLLSITTTSEQLRLGYNAGNYTSFTVGSDGALTITPSGSATTTISNILSVGSSAFFNNTLVVTNNSTLNGNVGLGDATGDSITATGRFASGLTPITNNTYDLGEGGLAWQDIYASGTVYADILKLDGLTESTMAGLLSITTTSEQLRLGYDAGNYTSFIVGSDGALTITPSGSATTTISNILSVGSSAFLNGILNVVGASTFNGNVGLGDATGDSITATGRFASGLTPITNNTYDLGEGGLAWQDIYASGTVYADILKLDGLTESTMAGLLSITTTSEQLRLGYDGTNYNTFTIDANGSLTVSSSMPNATTTFNNAVAIGNSNPWVLRQRTVGGHDMLSFYNETLNGDMLHLVNQDQGANVRVVIGTETSAYDFNIWDAALKINHPSDQPGITIGNDGPDTTWGSEWTNNFGGDQLSFVTKLYNGESGNYPIDGLSIYHNETSADVMYFTETGLIGIGTTTPSAKLHIATTSEQLRLGYDATNWASLTAGSDGDLTVSSSGALFLQPSSNTLYMAYDSTNSTRWNIASDGQLSVASDQPTTTFSNNVVIDNLYSGMLSLPEDGGLVDIIDIPVSTSAAASSTQGYVFTVDGLPAMSIYGLAAAGNVSDIGVSIGTTNTSSYSLYVASTNSTTPGLGVDGYIKATGFITGTTTLDLAETYPIDPDCVDNDSCPVAGDVICSVEKNGVYLIEKCTENYATTALGVISTDPGFVLGDYDLHKGLYPTSYRVVALAGRIPVKISDKNGKIKAGDYLTSSDIPGIAVKAVEPGRVIGVALNSVKASDSMVTMFVNTHWYEGDVSFVSDKLPTKYGPLNKFTLAVKNALRKLGLVVKNGIAKVKELRTDKLCVGDTCVDEQQFKELLQSKNIPTSVPSSPDSGSPVPPSPPSPPTPTPEPISYPVPPSPPSPPTPTPEPISYPVPPSPPSPPTPTPEPISYPVPPSEPIPSDPISVEVTE